ncbi:MAG: DeoR/GlpR transcriptional regulator [Candidatus Staskawiczbacteria bacterium]|nr:DeoR/GlpR transcriptional regulator [Candidatus Staskawiczbacteria bacterium]
MISERQKKILQILNEKGKAQVSDFKNVLIDVTKRTIRRDLDELLKNGKIVRVGEWNQVFYQIGQV